MPVELSQLEEATVWTCSGEAPGRNYTEVIFVLTSDHTEQLTYSSLN